MTSCHPSGSGEHRSADDSQFRHGVAKDDLADRRVAHHGSAEASPDTTTSTPPGSPDVSPQMRWAIGHSASATGAAGSGCVVSGSIPDGVYFGYLPDEAGTGVASSVDFDLACYYGLAATEARGIRDQDESIVNNSRRSRSLPVDPSLHYWMLNEANFGGAPTCDALEPSAPSDAGFCLRRGPVPRRYDELWQGPVFIRIDHGTIVEVKEVFLS